MSPQLDFDDVASHEILHGLARLHSLVVVSDLKGRVLWMSDAMALECGGAEHHVGNPMCQAFASLPGGRAQAKLAEQISHMQAQLQTHESVSDVRLDLGIKSGVHHSVDVSAFRTETRGGRPVVVAIVHPSRAEVGEIALRRERDALGSILDASPDAVIGLDRFGFIDYANDAVQSVLGVDPAKLDGQPVALLVPRSSELVGLVSELAGGQTIVDHELRIERPDGSLCWVAVDARSRASGPGEYGERFVFIRDVNHRVRERRALEKHNAELESYVHNVSHDLRSPLVSLLGFTRLLQQDYGPVLDETGRHFADRIEQAGRTMETLIEDLLELSRIGTGNEHRTLINPRAVLLQLQAELKLRLDEMGATLQIPDNPPLLMADRTRLYQIFSNLIGNALQHMGPCQDRCIRIDVVERGDESVITVSDRGQGVDGDDIERIFEAFHSQGRAACGRRSTGMGLAIVRKIAESHGGRAWAESTPGAGAEFHVSLPRD
jgi:PAS domain S-box-containing protein